MSPRVLVADDDPSVRTAARLLLRAKDMEVVEAATPEALLATAEREAFDVLLIDLNYERDTTSGHEGLELTSRLSAIEPPVPIVVMTGWGTIDLAVEAMKRGAADFIQKPWQNEHLVNTLRLQIRMARSEAEGQRLRQENRLLRDQLSGAASGKLIAESTAMRELMRQLERLSRSDMNILITGANGTGKSVLAEYLHNCSPRAGRPFISVNMGAIPEHLFESEMFGHTRGAFTDAKEERIGRFELAEEGTLFLDEIANIPLSQQAKLLRVLEERRYERVGSSRTRTADVRIVSATNAELDRLVAEGRFRQDLLYRLNTAQLNVPPLKERGADILPLARHFASRHGAKYQLPAARIGDDAASALQAYDWPGNVRELSHVIERAIFVNDSDWIAAGDLALAVTAEARAAAPEGAAEDTGLSDPTLTLEELERRLIRLRLQHFKGRVIDTARSLGLSRSAFYRRLEKFQL